MNLRTLALAGALVLTVSPVLATPLSQPVAASTFDADPSVQLVHHKPNHHGGPPWARRSQDPQDWRSGRDQDYGRYAGEPNEWRYDRAPERITVCRTVYRTEFDSFEGDYVRRPVQVCRERYGYWPLDRSAHPVCYAAVEGWGVPDDHHLHDRLARIERRLDHIVYGGVIGICVLAVLIWLLWWADGG